MAKNITKRQKDLLYIIYSFIKTSGYPPTFEEMRENLMVKSNQSVADLLNKLSEKKIIKRSLAAARGIAILPLGYKILGKPLLAPFLGATSAGAPMESIAIDGDWQPLSDDVAKLASDIFLLKISGDSMINAGIDDGDMVLVKEQKEFVSGDIVLAQMGDESTVKRFISDDKPPFIYLKPENPKYEVIPCTEKTRLKGKIISVIKNSFWRKTR